MPATAEAIPDFAPGEYVLADDIQWLATERAEARANAEELLESRRREHEAQPEIVILPVDALSSGDAVLEAEAKYGKASPEREELFKGLLQDCERLFMEWQRKNTSEYFPPKFHEHQEDDDAFYSHGYSINVMTDNAIVPISENPEEEERRKNEKVEEDSLLAVRRRLGGLAVGGAVLGNVAMRTISECPEKAIEDYAEDERYNNQHKDEPDFEPRQRGYGGYVPQILKLMIRDTVLNADGKGRWQEQVALSGERITRYIIERALARRNIDIEGMDKTELHGSQILARDSLLGFVALLDEVASEEWCTNIFMGEEVAADHPKDYEAFRREAMRRQDHAQEIAGELAEFILELAGDPATDRRRALAIVEGKVKSLLLEDADGDYEAVVRMFDKRTAKQEQLVSRLRSEGRHDEAAMAREESIAMAPGGGACGIDSCGIEGVSLSSVAGQRAAKLGLRAENGLLMRVTSARCINCRVADVYVDMFGGAACLSCSFNNVGPKEESRPKPAEEREDASPGGFLLQAVFGKVDRMAGLQAA